MMRHPRLIAFLVILLVIAGISALSWRLMQPQPRCIQGEVDCTKINVSAKIPGRVEEMRVKKGQRVEKGEIIAVLDRPQLDAKRQQASAAQSAAAAQRDKAENGAREEQIRMARQQWLQASAGAELAEKSFQRVQRLFDDGVLPAQRRDEVQAQRDMALKIQAAAKAQYDMAVNGTREEDKAAAAALVDQAGGAVSEVDSLIEEARVRAPIGGEVADHIVNLGELAAAGMPIVTLIDLNDLWIVFNVREDQLAGLKIGDKLAAFIPAMNNLPVDLEVFYLAALGDFAAWRATNITGGFDLRTFEVRAKIGEKLDNLRPGMTIVVPWNRVAAPDPWRWVGELLGRKP